MDLSKAGRERERASAVNFHYFSAHVSECVCVCASANTYAVLQLKHGFNAGLLDQEIERTKVYMANTEIKGAILSQQTLTHSHSGKHTQQLDHHHQFTAFKLAQWNFILFVYLFLLQRTISSMTAHVGPSQWNSATFVNRVRTSAHHHHHTEPPSAAVR